ncbi:hypothetical protein JWG42_17255 [Desulfoprunum benzoelyticum]|uniref:Outer-membrane lipoprotein LolB n=1 Tax=Desulfoprunum benzoelyticum TaxID=1506996 RepID=A0A840UT00_9BACT|nr:hypothetical protein [Desulfoprunum benzoelyticum]MBB5348922.1 hypothetical protein [Desulfoprunum benzoelyticum]MBM9531904.1 hypothetical protein [Desulfoprunum benzoelyticum]
MISTTRTDNKGARLLLPLLVLLLLVGGCARKPWRENLHPDQGRAAEQVFRIMQQRDAACPPCFDGDAVVAMKNHLDTRALSGYIQCRLPDHVKFIAANPLGQPLFAAATDGTTFTTINTGQRTAMSGLLAVYAELHDIPPAFFSGAWGEWLTGRIDQERQESLALRADGEARGTWISFRTAGGGEATTTHLLIDPHRALLLTRILADGKGRILAEINYGGWEEVGGCRQPTQITMRRLAFGGEISLDLARMQASDRCRTHDFDLPVPASYSLQTLP